MAEASPATLRGGLRSVADPADLLVARVGLVLVGANVLVGPGLNVALPLLLVWAPVTITSVVRSRSARVVVAVGTAAVVSGVVLAVAFAAPTHAWSTSGVVSGAALYLAILLSLAFVLWARTVMPGWQVALWYGGAALASAFALTPATENPWKFTFSWPIALVLLAVATRFGGLVAAGLALVPVMALSVVFDYRSFIGICAMTLAVCAWRVRPPTDRRPQRLLTTALLVAVVGAGAYQVGVSLLLRGSLGQENQVRTQTQIEQSGNLLVGGRPEWSATVRLMAQRPEGYGFGVEPGTVDLSLAQQGLAALDIPTGDGYAKNYMLAGGFRLHSVAADLWASQGVVGLLFGVMLVGVLGRAVLRGVSGGASAPLTTWLALMGLWDLGFSPTFSTVHHVAFAVAMVLPLGARE